MVSDTVIRLVAVDATEGVNLSQIRARSVSIKDGRVQKAHVVLVWVTVSVS